MGLACACIAAFIGEHRVEGQGQNVAVTFEIVMDHDLLRYGDPPCVSHLVCRRAGYDDYEFSDSNGVLCQQVRARDFDDFFLVEPLLARCVCGDRRVEIRFCSWKVTGRASQSRLLSGFLHAASNQRARCGPPARTKT